ncbi:FMN-dependent NADH-azoreductase [Phaeobacter marinintestinus]|uniref:FMN-dependent NADH-azoreductase n=1 Tax=Falsiphaeobacter marinintestinus TaxID=1492905 RepID=UPI0011B363DB|nr:NAD(P)H-dependent oxidoreductase [Phaeobacter marinintestinus]
MTRTVLHIDASARREGSTTRAMTDRILARLQPYSSVRRDLSTALPLITEDWVNANFTPADQRSDAQRETLALSDELVEELRAADAIVIGLPVYNFSVPAAFKAWIDLVARAGETFRYTAEGPQGLLTDKRAIVAIASGGTAVGSEIDFASGYVQHILGFMGIKDVELVAADRLAIDPEGSQKAADAAIDRIAA